MNHPLAYFLFLIPLFSFAQTPPQDFSCFGGSASSHQYTDNDDFYYRFTYGVSGKCVGYVATTCNQGMIVSEEYFTNAKKKYGYAVYEYDEKDSCTRYYVYKTLHHGFVMLPNNTAKWDWTPDTLEQEIVKTFKKEGDFVLVNEKILIKKELWLVSKYHYKDNLLMESEDNMGFYGKFFYEGKKLSKVEYRDSLNVLQNYTTYTYLGDSIRIGNEHHLQEDGEMLLDCRRETFYNKQGKVLIDKCAYLNTTYKTWDSNSIRTFTYDEKGRLLTECNEDAAPLMETDEKAPEENKK